MLTRLKNRVNAWRMKNHVKSMCRECVIDRHGLPPVMQFASDDFNAAWEQALSNVIKCGVPITFGGNQDNKLAIDTMQTIVLGNHAIEQILSKHLHPKFPFKMVDQYLEEFTTEYLEKYRNQGSDRFDYIYYDRFDKYDQILNMRKNLMEQIKSGVISNRNQMTTWIPAIDQYKSASPCLQKVRVRYEYEDLVSVTINWRSRDLFGAWQINLVGVINTIYRDVIKPNECRIARVVDQNDSLHVYKTDLEAAIRVIMRV